MSNGDENEAVGEDEDPLESSDMGTVIPHLLGSINNERLAFFCGAGLSMGCPSCLPSADEMVSNLQEEYRYQRNHPLPDEAGETLEEIAAWAISTGAEFQNFFLNTLRTDDFFRDPNIGHSTVADFLLTGAATAAISTNVDYLIERAAEKLGEADFRGFVRDNHLERDPDHSPLLKLHGCFRREERYTVWCEEQLTQQVIQNRIEAFRNWMRANLPGNDLLIIGYWTDWPYLNETLDESIRDIEPYPRSVILVDPSDPAELRSKAEGLWEWVEEGQINFHHVERGGNEFMLRLRQEFSKRFFRLLLREVQKRDLTEEYYRFESSEEVNEPPIEDMREDQIYTLRRDFTGAPDGRPVTEKEPTESHHEKMGAFHEVLMENSASMDGHLYKIDGEVVRIINGRGYTLSRIREKHEKNNTNSRAVDTCVGVGVSGEVPGPQNFVREEKRDDVVKANRSAEWCTDEEFINECDELDRN